MWSGTGRKRKNEGIKILDEEPGVLPAQSVHLLSPAGWSNQHTTLRRQAATPGTATQFGVPSQPACSQSLFFFPYLCGNMRDWFLCVYILLKIVFECWQGAVVKENWAPKYKNPESFLRVIVEPLIMQSLTLQSLCRPLTELVHTYLSILQEKAWVLPVVWVRHIFSLACMSFSHVFILKMTHFPLRSELYCCRCGARYRQLYEQWEHISAGITLQTGCGGGGGGFSLTDLSLQSHLFFGLSAPECSVSGWSSAHRIISGIFAKTSTTSYSEMRCLRIHTVQYVREMEEEDEVVGGWVGGVTRRWLVHPTEIHSKKSLERGSLCGLERVAAPLRCVGIADFKTVELIHRKRGREEVSSGQRQWS